MDKQRDEHPAAKAAADAAIGAVIGAAALWVGGRMIPKHLRPHRLDGAAPNRHERFLGWMSKSEVDAARARKRA